MPFEIRNIPGFVSLAILWSESLTVVWNGIGRVAPLQIPAENPLDIHSQADSTLLPGFRECFRLLCPASSCSQIDYLIGSPLVIHTSNIGSHQLIDELSEAT